jgi:hypothetical protein
MFFWKDRPQSEGSRHADPGIKSPPDRFTSAQNSRHVDRKMFKMRELRGAGVVTVELIPTDDNPADLFTKILSRQVFERHRCPVLNLVVGRATLGSVM